MTRKHEKFRFTGPATTKQPVQVETIYTAVVQIELKTFTFRWQVNSRGPFLRIVEHTRTRTNSIVIPATGLQAFQRTFSEVVNCRSPGGPNH